MSIEFDKDQREYAEKHDLPLVRIEIDSLHCTGAYKWKVGAAGPAPDDFAAELRKLILKWDQRFNGQEPR
jgi:hypothetical protein